MVGIQAFPSTLGDVKLERITYFARKYPGITIGYADHSSYSDQMSKTSNEYAFILGARLFENILPLKKVKRTDWQSALSTELNQ